MNRRTWFIIGGVVLVALIAAYFVKSKQDQQASNQQSQLPAQQEQARYTTPPDIGVTGNAPTNVVLPSGEDVSYTMGHAQALPITPYAGDENA